MEKKEDIREIHGRKYDFGKLAEMLSEAYGEEDSVAYEWHDAYDEPAITVVKEPRSAVQSWLES